MEKEKFKDKYNQEEKANADLVRHFKTKMQERKEEHEADKQDFYQMMDKKDAEKETFKKKLDDMTSQKNVLKM